MKNVHEPTYSFVILTLVLIVINAILARLCVIALPGNVGGVSVLFFAVAFMILFTLWFGAYGAIAAYAGTFIGAGLLSTNPVIPAGCCDLLVDRRPPAGSHPAGCPANL